MFSNSNKYLQFVAAFLATAFTILQGIDWLFSKLDLEWDYYYILLSILLIAFLIGAFILYSRRKKTEKKEGKEPETNGKKKTGRKILPYLNVGITILLAIFFIYYFQKGRSDENLLENKLPQIISAYENNEMLTVYRETKKLLDEENDNPIVRNYFNKVTEKVSIYTEPANVSISFKLVSDTLDVWEPLGSSPIDSIQVPWARIDLKFKFEDREYNEYTHPYYLINGSNIFVLPKSGDVPTDHRIFLGGSKSLAFPGIDHLPKVKIGAYSMSRLEVTNKEYKAFVEAGAYEDRSYWDFPVIVDGEELTFKNTIGQFVDKFGQPGPANWSYGNFPDGQDDYPVTGISWYEAMAFAKFKGLSLPNLYQWNHAARLSWASQFVPNSNFSQNQLVDVGSLDSENPNGLYDIAGNVREWVINSVNDKAHKKAILGGAFTDAPYFFNDFYGQNALDRSIGNGMRLVKNMEDYGKDLDVPESEIAIEVRDFLNEEPVSDDVFEIFRAQFDYKSKPLNATTMNSGISAGSYTADRFEISSPYEENAVLPGYVFYDSTWTDTLKPIIFFPGSGAIHLTNTELMIRNNLEFFAYLMNEGYAIFLPIYLGTYEREDDLKSDYPNDSEFYKDHVISWGKDYKRTIDYIASRDDMDMQNFSYYGVSWGGFMANILLAIDDRVKNSVLYVAGLTFQRSKNEVEAYHYTSRIKIPVLMLNGKFDQFFPLETSQIPMYELLGTKKEDKKHYIFETGHFVPKEELIREHLAWLNKYEAE